VVLDRQAVPLKPGKNSIDWLIDWLIDLFRFISMWVSKFTHSFMCHFLCQKVDVSFFSSVPVLSQSLNFIILFSSASTVKRHLAVSFWVGLLFSFYQMFSFYQLPVWNQQCMRTLEHHMVQHMPISLHNIFPEIQFFFYSVLNLSIKIIYRNHQRQAELTCFKPY